MSKDKKEAMVGTWVLTLFLLSLILAIPGRVLAVDAFIKIADIKGESTDDKHKEWIPVISWSFGDTNSGTALPRGGVGAGAVKMQDFKFTMRTNSASPKLFLAVAKGEHIPKVTFEVCKSTGDKLRFLQILLTDVVVSSFVNLGGSTATDLNPTEEVMLNFGKIEITYTEIDPKSGKPKGDIKSNWDLKANKGG